MKKNLLILKLIITLSLAFFLTSIQVYSQYLENFHLYQISNKINTSKSKTKTVQSDGTKIAKKQVKSQEIDSNAIVLADSTERKDRIISLNQVGDVHILKIELSDYNSEISIVVYNLIGKKVMDVYKGMPKSTSPDYPYEIQSWRLPNGIYLCTLQGRNFRKTEKFVVAR